MQSKALVAHTLTKKKCGKERKKKLETWLQLWNLLKLLTQRRWNNFTATRMVCRGRSWASSLQHTQKKTAYVKIKSLKVFMMKLVLMAVHGCWRSATGSRVNAHPWQGCGKSDSFSLALQLSLSPSLTLTHSLTLTLSLSLLRSADSVQGTPAAGFWVRIYISLNIRQRGNRNTGRDRKRSHLSQMLADWSGGSLSKEFDQNKLARRKPETHAAFLANRTKNQNSNLPSFWQQMACVLWNDCLARKINTKLLTPSTSERNLASPLTLRIN